MMRTYCHKEMETRRSSLNVMPAERRTVISTGTAIGTTIRPCYPVASLTTLGTEKMSGAQHTEGTASHGATAHCVMLFVTRYDYFSHELVSKI